MNGAGTAIELRRRCPPGGERMIRSANQASIQNIKEASRKCQHCELQGCSLVRVS